MIPPIEIENCQKFLDGFNKVPEGNKYSGQSMFRIVWSKDRFETRYGVFNEYENNIFIRTVTGHKEVPKYWFYPECWVLEQWYGPDVSYSSDVPDSVNGVYECFYAFIDDKNKPLPFNMKVVEIRMKYKMQPAATHQALLSYYKDLKDQQEKEEEKHFAELTEDDGTGRVGEADLVHAGSGIFVPRTFGDVHNVLRDTKIKEDNARS